MRYVVEFNRGRGDLEWYLSGNRLSTDDRILIRDTEFPSLEAARREAAYHQNRSSYIYRARDTQEGAEMPVTGVARTEPTVAQARAVRIYRRNREWVIDAGGRSLPMMPNLYPYMTLSSRQSCRDRGDYQITDALLHGVSPQMLSSALAAWFTEHPNPSGNEAPLVQEEGVSELPNNSAYLAMGDFIYKMVPVRQASSSKAVKLMREKARVEIERVREGLRQQAANEAQQVIIQANQRAAVLRAEAQAELNAAQSAPKFPAWTQGLTVRMGGDRRIYVLKKLSIPIKTFTHGGLQWKAKEGLPVSAWLWLPLDGVPERVAMFDSAQGYLPHITTSGACMKIGETVTPITSLATLDKFAAQVQRVHSAINLASLLNPQMDTWLPEVKAIVPDSIKTWLGRYTLLHDQRTARDMPAGHETLRGDETWSVR